MPLIAHSLCHLRHNFPCSAHIRSSNPDPLTFWHTGSQVVLWNWQTYGTPVQVDKAMFIKTQSHVYGTNGWVAKLVKPQGEGGKEGCGGGGGGGGGIERGCEEGGGGSRRRGRAQEGVLRRAQEG
ncbi:uncharacterized protein SCHCODRAFT_02685887 [Schizophyllum commune H4-8]|nr:uncharacterized protein SCHCODRAFT_02685887 [Schizophyllum commune H4-8]KAI5896985.1 hypothetical protein SCHCODRAFT_02685887 [Schizophyllum commune H4-8]